MLMEHNRVTKLTVTVQRFYIRKVYTLRNIWIDLGELLVLREVLEVIYLPMRLLIISFAARFKSAT